MNTKYIKPWYLPILHLPRYKYDVVLIKKTDRFFDALFFKVIQLIYDKFINLPAKVANNFDL